MGFYLYASCDSLSQFSYLHVMILFYDVTLTTSNLFSQELLMP